MRGVPGGYSFARTSGGYSVGPAGSVTLAPNGSSATPTTDGQLEYDSSQVRYAAGSNTETVSFPKVLFAAAPTSDCLAGATTTGCSGVAGTTETAFSTTATIKAGAHGELITGKIVRVTFGLDTTGNNSSVTVQFGLRVTSATGTQLFLSTSSQTLNGNRSGILTILLGGTAAAWSSASVNADGGGIIQSGGVAGTVSQPVTMSTSTDILLVPTAKFSAITANNTISVQSMTVEALN